ncbi:GNAT family N-acetyltransferase [Micromonospora sp. NPDC049679]|uniref:GNAT family N-acetyltransferase n=1 Tax=Micromonospora sp. NPDC049679 TaxID=3155920 RepID=UPI0033FD6621
MTSSHAVFAVCPDLTDDELNELFTASWPGHTSTSFAPMMARSIAWIAALRGRRLVGFVNVAGDGGAHAFILDTTVHPDERRRGAWATAGPRCRRGSTNARSPVAARRL